MRTKKALLNVIFNTITQILNIIIMLVVRRTFSRVLGDDLLGLNSVYSSIVSFLTLSELGISTATAVILYKPLAENDERGISAYIFFMKKAYTIVGIIIILGGTLLIPFLRFIIKEDFGQYYLATSFELYVLATGSSYFWSYKRTLFGADQKSYILSLSQGIYKIAIGVGQLIALLLTSSFHVYILVLLLGNLAENIILSALCDHQYPFLKAYKKERLNKGEWSLVKDKIEGILCFKISNYIIQGTDNIIISRFLSTLVVAYYNNFFLIANLLYSMFVNIAVSATAGLGNIIYTEREKLMITSKKLVMVMQYVFMFSSIGFFILSPFFVKRVFPTSDMMPLSVLILMTAIHFLRGYSEAMESIRNSVGNYWDRYLNIAVAGLNVVLSVVLVKYIGLAGILVGTLVCYFLKGVVILPYMAFKQIFNVGMKEYYLTLIRNVLIVVVTTFILYYLTSCILIDSWLKWLCAGTVILLVTFLINTVFYRKTMEYKELKQYVLTNIKNILYGRS